MKTLYMAWSRKSYVSRKYTLKLFNECVWRSFTKIGHLASVSHEIHIRQPRNTFYPNLATSFWEWKRIYGKDDIVKKSNFWKIVSSFNDMKEESNGRNMMT